MRTRARLDRWSRGSARAVVGRRAGDQSDANAEEQFGIPAPALELHEALRTSHGVLIASPEYNANVSPLLSNALAWTSRVQTPRSYARRPGDCRGQTESLTAAAPAGALSLAARTPDRRADEATPASATTVIPSGLILAALACFLPYSALSSEAAAGSPRVTCGMYEIDGPGNGLCRNVNFSAAVWRTS